jgi:hypothetical protein
MCWITLTPGCGISLLLILLLMFSISFLAISDALGLGMAMVQYKKCAGLSQCVSSSVALHLHEF